MHVFVGAFRTVRVQARELLFEGLHKGVLYVFMEEEVVRRNAGLAAVEALSPGNAAGGKGKVGFTIHYAGALAAKLQHHWREVFRLGFHCYPAKGGAAGEEHKVVAMLEEFPVDQPVTLHHRNVFLREGVGNHGLKGFGHIGNVRRGLQDGRAPGRNCAHKRVKEKLHGIVPGAHDEGASKGLPHDETLGRHAG